MKKMKKTDDKLKNKKCRRTSIFAGISVIVILISILMYGFVIPRITLNIKIDFFEPPLPIGPTIVIGLKITNSGTVTIRNVNITLLLVDVSINRTILKKIIYINSILPWYSTENVYNQTFGVTDYSVDQMDTYRIVLGLSYDYNGYRWYQFEHIYNGSIQPAKIQYEHKIFEWV